MPAYQPHQILICFEHATNISKSKLPVSSTCACTYAVPAPVQLYVKLRIAQSDVENQYKATQIIYESMDTKKISKYHQNCSSSIIRRFIIDTFHTFSKII